MDAPPAGTGHAGDAVVAGQRLVEEGVVGVEDLVDGAVGLEEVLEEQDGLLEERLAQPIVEGREELFVLLAIAADLADVQPLRAELGRQPTHLRILEHSRHLGRAPLGVSQFPCRGGTAQFGVWQRRPQEVTQPRRQFPVGDRLRFLARRRAFEAEEE